MLRKLIKSSGDSTPIDLPPPPTVDQMLSDLASIGPSDPVFQVAPLDCFTADLGEKAAPDGISPTTDDAFRKLSKLSSLCDEIRSTGEFLGEKRMALKSLTKSAIETRKELESIVKWTAVERPIVSGGKETGAAIKRMNHNPDTKSGFFVSNQQRRLSLEAIGLRRSSSNNYSYESVETDALGCHSAGDDDHENDAGSMEDVEETDDAGFAAIELLRPHSQSMEDGNAQSDDASSTDEGGGDVLGHPSSSKRSSNGIDLSFMTLEDLLYQLQREIGRCVAQSEVSASGNSKKFLWSEQAKNLLECAIEKLRLRDQLETNGFSSMNASEYVDAMNRMLLPLWPQGWMSSTELTQVIREVVMADHMEEDDERAEVLDQYSEGPEFGNDDGAAGSHYRNEQGIDAAYSSGSESPVAASSYQKTPNRQLGNGSEGGSTTTSGGTAMCFICDRSFQSPHLLKIHISHMHTPKALVCPHCQSRHSTLNGLRFHFSTKHKGLSQRFINDLVPPAPLGSVVSFASAYAAQQAAAPGAAYTESRGIGSVENSSMTVNRMNSTIRNQLPHRSTAAIAPQNGSSAAVQESSEVECSSCKNKFASVGALKAHISMMHTEKNVRCRYCPNMYATQRAMLQHTYLKHHKERNCQCPTCGETFQTPGLANMHRRFAHCGNTTTASTPPSAKLSTHSHASHNSLDEELGMGMDGAHAGTISATIQSAMSRIRGNGKYHCRDCGAGFPMPSAVWAHRKKEHSDSTSIKKRGVFSLSDPKRVVGGQIFAHDLLRQSKDAANGKKKMRVKCSVCSAIFSNGYACYLHKKKIHGEESIRRELNLSERSSTSTTTLSATAGAATSVITSIPAAVTEVISQPLSNPLSASENLNPQPATSGSVSQARMSTSSSSSRDSSPFYRGGDTLLAEGIVRRRYEFHCQCGMTFYNGFAFSRHRQRTGCSDGVRGVVVKESICGVCSEAFPTTEQLNEHFTSTHGGSGFASIQAAATMPKFSSPSTMVASGGDMEEGAMIRGNDVHSSTRETSSRDTNSGGSMADNRSSPAVSTPASQGQRLGATATAYVTTSVLKRLPETTQSSAASSNQHERQERSSSISLASVLRPSDASAVASMDRYPLRCLWCPYETYSIDALNEHRHRHEKSSMAGSMNQSACPYCTYVTDSINSYVRHTALHLSNKGSSLGLMTGTKRNELPAILDPKKKACRLECVYCGRRFLNTSELMEHEFMHGTGK